VGPGAFAAAVAEARTVGRAAGRELVDLTVSNPTVCGFFYDAEAVLGALGGLDKAARGLNDAMVYDPDPRGMRSAREAVAGYYADHAASVDPDAVVLTTSTSEAYSYLFRLLCDAGDEVLVPVPSYPLFEFLADLDDVRLRPYTLFYDYGWWIDLAELERRIGPKTRAVIVVHPNNPTGHWTHRAERERLEEICARRGVALIVDEVFLDYPVAGAQAAESFAVGPHPALTFVLSGISKIAALPQMKVAWLASCGPEAAVGEAMARLEVIADTFLSMNAPVQLALPQWLSGCGALQRQIRERVVGNLDVLRQSGLEVLRVEAGWSAVVRLRGEDAGAMRLMREQGVVAHPGEFYGLADKRMVVLSLITPGEVFAEGIGRAAVSAIA
jgi:aspartate/methionine/tyrosine aminotransferase